MEKPCRDDEESMQDSTIWSVFSQAAKIGLGSLTSFPSLPVDMMEQQQKQLELILAIGKAGKLIIEGKKDLEDKKETLIF
ncbi:hypothetical protein Taro_034618 [Colocasia esculenta]|uniref:Uncharacterized protein n=1 Tax=Colocasia esculenta TaxID=4460 RepID=A0A843W3E8_COLES|nr:hypothetical protein [Colocasia esculenta]